LKGLWENDGKMMVDMMHSDSGKPLDFFRECDFSLRTWDNMKKSGWN
jgi:hypothetical protein